MRNLLACVLLLGCGRNHFDGVEPDADDPAPDGSTADAAAGSAINECFPGLADPTKPHPNYDQFHPIMNADCTGTNYQDIAGVEKVVFLGDSITTGTPPTLPSNYYRSLVGAEMTARFGSSIEIKDCSKWGATTDDLLEVAPAQIGACFADVEPKQTLVVMTIGGNDMNGLQKAAATDTPEQTIAKVDLSVARMNAALAYLKSPQHFPNGSFVVFANVYEFTDGTGDLPSCPAAALAGVNKPAAAQMVPAHLHLQEQLLRLAIEHGADMVFTLETFCGHGFHKDDPTSQCFQGANAPLWFDPFTCIHPNTVGHQEMARMFETTIAD